MAKVLFPVHRLLSLIISVVALALGLALPSAASAQAPSCPAADVQPTAASLIAARTATLCLINAQRTSRALAPLRANRRLRAAAEGYSGTMVARSFFDHVSPVDGSTLQRRVTATRYLAGVASWRLAENIAWGTGELSTPAHTVDAWMRSPGHRRNILSSAYTEIGIGIALGAPEEVPDELGAATYTTDFGFRG
jgi:uncharacterized protein YkwD